MSKTKKAKPPPSQDELDDLAAERAAILNDGGTHTKEFLESLYQEASQANPRGAETNQGNCESAAKAQPEPNAVVAPMHEKAMPVILMTSEDIDRWAARRTYPCALNVLAVQILCWRHASGRAAFARGRTVVADQPAKEAHEDRHQGRGSRPLRHLPFGRGRGAEGTVQANYATDRWAATPTGSGIGLRRPSASSPRGESV